jgi:hypothetical protein
MFGQNRGTAPLKSWSQSSWGHNKEKVTLHVSKCDILANLTQMSDVAPGPLVKLAQEQNMHRILYI